MDPLGVTATIIAVIQLTCGLTGYLSDIQNAPKQCQQFVEEASNLLVLLTSLKYRAEQHARDDWFQQLRLLNAEDGPLQQYKQALMLLQSRTEIGSGIQKIKRRILWTLTKDEVASILGRMERLKSLVCVALEMDHFKLSQAIKEDVAALRNALSPLQTDIHAVEVGIRTLQLETQSIRDNTTSIRDAVPSLQANTINIMDIQRTQQHQHVLQWLSPTDFPAQQHSIISRRQDGTAQWFLDSTAFKRWSDGAEKTLFCPGIPGAGKTMMAAVGIEYLLKATRLDNNIGAAYVFCSYKAEYEQSMPSLLAALLKQLVQNRPDLAIPVKDVYDKCQGGKASFTQIYEALRSVTSAYKTVYLVVDALDEYNDRDGNRAQFIDKLLQLQEKIDVRILFTSRFLPVILERFKSVPTLEVRASEEDVRQFVEGQLSRLPLFIQRDLDLQKTIVVRITEAADGMFLLARLHVGSLYDKRNKSRVLTTLDKISQRSGTLDEAYSEAYDEAIKRIDSQSPDDKCLARRSLCWISHAQRLLTTDELCCALAIEPNDRSLNDDNVYDIRDVTSVCAGLITVEEGTSIVRLVHYTTQEYFERVRIKWYPGAQSDIAAACLTYLCFDTFQSGSCDSDKAFEDRLVENEFFDYSARFWGQHVQPVQNSHLSEPAVHFLCNRPLLESAIQAAYMRGHPRRGYSQRFPKRMNALHLVAQHGLESLAGLLLENRRLGLEANSKDDDGQTPLLRAAANGHEAVVKLLLATDRVEVDSKDNYDRTPLSWAAANGHEAVVKLLLATDRVEVDSKNNFGQTPLLRAAANGREAVVKLLLATDRVEVDSKDNFGQMPLSWAAANGHEAVVKLLLATDRVEVDSKDDHGPTPLLRAAANGHEAVVKLLLATDRVEVDSKDNYDRTPLSWAAANGHEAVVKLLLATDRVEVDSKDNFDRTPLSWAAVNGHEAVVKLLLATDRVEVDSKDNYDRTPLSWAAVNGHEAVVKLLLATDRVEVDSKDNYDRTPLSWAAANGHEAVVKLLLATDRVEVDSKNNFGQTPLLRAAANGREAVVKLLLATDRVKVDSRDSEGQTPLSMAANYRHEAVVQILLDSMV